MAVVMDIETVRQFLDDPADTPPWLSAWGIADAQRAHTNLLAMAEAGVTLDLLANLATQLAENLPASSDPDRALNNLERFIRAARSPLALAALFEREPHSLAILLQIFATSQHLSDVLIGDAESYDLLRMTEGQPVARDVLVAELVSEIETLTDEKAVMWSLRQFKRRETLRIAYGDIIHGQRLDTVARQISYVADACLEAALDFASRKLGERFGQPRKASGEPARFVVLALGKLGGSELNYSSDIDVMFLYDEDGATDGEKQLSSVEYFDRLVREIVRLLTDSTELGAAYRVDLRLRPEGKQGPIVSILDGAYRYYETAGRTWERQAFVKARPVAGDLALGEEFLERLSDWIYHRYLNRADIAGIRALKRKIEKRAISAGIEARDVKTGHGGIRDIEFAIQFLQLLNGGELAQVRTSNTLEAIARLESAGCLTHQERTLLEENYCFLRKIEHRLQVMFDLQTHEMPEEAEELRRVAIRMGYNATDGDSLAAFRSDYAQRTAENRKILDHLLHDAFPTDGESQPEVDLVMDPEPSEEQIRAVLSPYKFRNVDEAYRNLTALAKEKVRFLSTRRCRHFLASIARELLQAIADTPDPDATLVSLAQVSDSLGGKGVVWELFRVHPPSLKLYVELCSSSPYLSSILMSSPGMIDELMDSLVLDSLPTLPWLDATLSELCRAAEDVDPILHSFKNSQHLRVGVRDILGKDDIRETTAALSDVAQVCLKQIAVRRYDRLAEKYGHPILLDGPLAGKRCEPVILGMGKFGGREPNYHSDLDVIFVYEGDGTTQHSGRGARNDSSTTTTNQHFFGEFGQRIVKSAGLVGPHGRLYEVDARLRPTGRSGAMATSFDEFARYFAEGHGALWERMALCKTRVVFGEPEAADRAMEVVTKAAFGPEWQPEHADEVRSMRLKLEETASPRNLKRGPGGIVDVEFLVQLLQLRYGGVHESIRVPGTLAALDQLKAVGLVADDDYDLLTEGYRFLRNAEARIRLMNAAGRHELPEDEGDLEKLARLMRYDKPQRVEDDWQEYSVRIRECFNRYVDAARAATV